MNMPTFHVYQHRVLGYAAVNAGFSWPGFFFTWIWAFVKKMWPVGGWLLGTQYFGSLLVGFLIWQLVGFRADALTHALGLGWLPVLPPFALLTPVGFGLAIATGFQGNAWLREYLPTAGYEYLGSANVPTAGAAIAQAVEGNLEIEELPYDRSDVLDYELDLGPGRGPEDRAGAEPVPPYLVEYLDYEEDLVGGGD